jgi:(p)ppGpp synthase/HD superfamily hydrolase
MSSSTDSKNAKLANAFCFAIKAHSRQYRKGTSIPYIVHPMDVASILMKNLAPENVVIAGLLHDVVEDTDTSILKIEEIFGKKVAALVQQASEPQELLKGKPKEMTWKARKTHTILKIIDLDYDAKLLSCADKLSNIRDLISDKKIRGDALWSQFNATKEEQSWYYHSLLDAYLKYPPDISDKPLISQFKEAVMTLFSN